MKRVCVLLVSLTALINAEIAIVPERLTVDGIFWGDAVFAQGRDRQGWANSHLDFKLPLAVFGATGRLAPGAHARLELDANQRVVRDLFVEFQWNSGIGLRVGQFKPAYSFECEVPERELKFEEYSLLHNGLLKPGGPRDIGLSFSYAPVDAQGGALRLYGTVVNGTGANTGDDNSAKDVCGRVVIKPVAGIDLWCGLRGYYGWVYPEAVRWLSAASEVRFRQGCFSAEAEFIFRRFQNQGVVAADVMASEEFGPVAPAVRVEFIRWENGNLQARASAGVGYQLIQERLKVYFGYQYHTVVSSWDFQALILRLQAVF